MDGEKPENPIDHQPGGRQPAPGQLALVQSFVNTRWNLATNDHGETFTDPQALQSWFASRALVDEGRELSDKDLARALTIREGLRALAFANNGRAPADPALAEMREASGGLQIRVGLEPDGPEFLINGAGDFDAAIGQLIAIAAQAKIEGAWKRLKACPGRNCGWVFFDSSRNGSSRWCSMKVCGDREKSRAHYWRRAGPRA